MKHPVVILCFILAILFVVNGCRNSTDKDSYPVRIMSYNTKFDDKADTLNGWDQRKEQLVNLISFYDPDFIGTQEGLLHQLDYIKDGLPNMQWIGVGRADGKTKGEFSALFYNTDRFELVGNTDSTIWLSKTTAKPSKSWDAALPRILTWGKFRNTSTQKEFYVFNTHFDHIGDTARTESAKLIVETVKKIVGNSPVILMGDFNVTPNAKPYIVLTQNNSSLQDAYHQSVLPHVGPEFSFEGFEVMGSSNKRRIDYIFANDKVDVLKHAIISDFRDGRYPSDHLPVIADVRIK
jgi:endonuclease/exonuclease/phosphatase family metal-dependent hydrolase